MNGFQVLKLPPLEQRLYYANQRIKALQDFAESMTAPHPRNGALPMLYQHASLGELTAHYTPDEDGVIVEAVYLCSKDIMELLDEKDMASITKACAASYAKACADSNLDHMIERKYG